MNVIRITKEFTFEMAHALGGYDGKCKEIHGHSYFLSVTIKGSPISAEVNPKAGMVMDFGDLKKIVNEEIIKKFDHVLVLHDKDERFHGLAGAATLLATPYQPTCENLLIDFVSRLKKYFTGDIQLFSLMLRETPTSYAEWYAED